MGEVVFLVLEVYLFHILHIMKMNYKLNYCTGTIEISFFYKIWLPNGPQYKVGHSKKEHGRGLDKQLSNYLPILSASTQAIHRLFKVGLFHQLIMHSQVNALWVAKITWFKNNRSRRDLNQHRQCHMRSSVSSAA